MSHYIREYLRKSCSSELQALFCQSHNTAKEITESMGAFENMKEFINTQDESHTYICIGDGSLCMTGALFAFLTKSEVISIDPLVNKKVEDWIKLYKTRRFNVFKAKYQDIPVAQKAYDLILVHAHVELTDLVKYFPNWRYLYTNPCCCPETQTFSVQYQKGHDISVVKAGRDNHILSKNEIVIYRNNKIHKKSIYSDIGSENEKSEGSVL
jgi:hypothetical protein